MRALLRRRVDAKIIFGYLVALILMVWIGLVAVVQLDQINSTVGNLTDELAVERGVAQEIVSQVWLVRFYANKYVRTQNQTDLDSFNSEFDRLEGLLVQADQLTTNTNRREKLDRIKTAVEDYRNAFQQVTEIIKRRQILQSGTLDVQGLIVENKLAALRVIVNALNVPQAFLAFGNAQSGFQQMRLNVVNYLATNDEGYVVLFNKGYQDARAAFSTLQATFTVETQQQNAVDARAAAQAYYEGFQTIHADNVTLKNLFTTQLDVLEPEISATASEIATDVAQEFKAKNQSSQDLVSDTRLIVGGTTLVAIVLVLSLGIGLSRHITRPLQRVMRTSQQIANVDLEALTTQLDALSQGDLRLNLNVTAEPLEITSSDEVGQMATAFNEIIARLRQSERAFKDMATYLNTMAETATTVAQGNLNVNVPVQSQVDVLGNALAGMVADLRAARSELQKHQEHLEELVAQRTRQLEREKQYLEALVRNSPAAIVVIDLDSTIVSWNPAAEALFGYTRDQVMGRVIDEVVTSENQIAEAHSFSQQTIGENTLIHAVTQRQRKDSTTIDVEVLGVPVVVDGEKTGALAIYHDVTELQRARREAEEANHAKSAFLAMMSHEIRTPMNGVIGMTSLLLDTALTPEQREYANTIRDSGEALLSIINDILDFSKIEAGKMELENQPFDLRECVESALDLIVTSAREKSLELVYLIDSQVPTMLNGDVTRLRQILLNLMSNAIKFTDAGEVVLSVRLAQPPTDSSHKLEFSVRDTGIGIPADRLDRLFESFSQVDASTTRRYGGTGLGLAISRRLAEMMGGVMWAESTAGKGSAFYFTIEAEAAPAQARVYLRSEQPQLRDRHVLIVDDNATNQRVLVAQTRSWHMLPRETASPTEALSWVKRGDPFDLVLLDMQMPEMDGITLATQMRRYRDEKTLPIVMLSSLDRRETGTEAIRFEAYLIKPIKQSVLYDTLVSVFAGQPTIVRPHVLERESEFDTHLAERLPLHILVAEDNAVNQKLALQMLRRMGYRADVAGNGFEVLEALNRQPYDVVLMDVQMPEMDGLETTRRIHEQWSQNRPYIVAMTANAMQGDREICLAAGMDDYISKPIQVTALQNALQRWGARAPDSTEVDGKPDPKSVPATIDWSVLDQLRTLQEEGEQDFVQETIDLYLTDAPSLIDAIRRAISANDAGGLKLAAHSLKGNSNSLGAQKIGALSLELEKIGRSGTVEGAEPLLIKLESEFQRVRQVFTSMNET